jgi:hypothetical protein
VDSGEAWPPASGAREALQFVALVDETPSGVTPLLIARVWVEEPAVCAFDPVLQDCR